MPSFTSENGAGRWKTGLASTAGAASATPAAGLLHAAIRPSNEAATKAAMDSVVLIFFCLQ